MGGFTVTYNYDYKIQHCVSCEAVTIKKFGCDVLCLSTVRMLYCYS